MADFEYSALPRSVQEFRPRCPGCSPDKVTAEGGTPCSFYDCPGIPSELQVTCEMCLYDFAAIEGQVKCDHRSCETAKRLQKNVPTYRAWVAMIRAEFAGQA
jgi:hypothetical protein